MTTNPQLPNHVIRELMNTIRLKGSGDAMVLLARSGKETFPVFKYVVETTITVDTDRYDTFLQNLASKRSTTTPLNFRTEEAKRFVIRFVRHLTVMDIPFKQLPFEKITHLTIECYGESHTSLLNSWTDLEDLKMNIISDQFFTDLISGTISLTKLRKLDISLTFNQFLVSFY
uniref:BTB domain-containing protein n=1 Tax=Panagrellus redivivus TaxID=6233 RepID=A0A7E4W3V9_PANRE